MSDGAGLVVLIKPNGSKLWRYRYSRDGRKQKLSLGSYPELSLAQARVKAADARAKLAQGNQRLIKIAAPLALIED
ncbi:Arm DNA-binding domain-containing protein [Klebsiella sp. R445]